jgi:hypothetical protein
MIIGLAPVFTVAYIASDAVVRFISKKLFDLITITSYSQMDLLTKSLKKSTPIFFKRFFVTM